MRQIEKVVASISETIFYFMNTKPFSERQRHTPTSVKMWPDQRAELDVAAKSLGISFSRLMRSAALTVARELKAGAEQPLCLHR